MAFISGHSYKNILNKIENYILELHRDLAGANELITLVLMVHLTFSKPLTSFEIYEFLWFKNLRFKNT